MKKEEYHIVGTISTSNQNSQMFSKCLPYAGKYQNTYDRSSCPSQYNVMVKAV
jgi:hypothetical protein